MSSELLDVEEAAAHCHVKVSTMRSWVLGRKVCFIKLGRRIFFRRGDLDRFINESLVPARAEAGRVGEAR